MRLNFLLRRAPIIAAAGVIASASVGACTHRSNIYDAQYNDYHRWNAGEEAAYRRWETERAIQHIDYQQRAANDQRAYWTWRHAHPG